ncbi:MAG TPA: NAD(P)-dependent oxidoreductase [Thermomicrobiales bacterium]|nr:NAD(P)-dependent oxidoreductase [Thermomicrobiales bacterium]
MSDSAAAPTSNRPVRTVLITGAEGQIGTALREHLAGEFEFRYLTREPQDFASHVGDIADLNGIRPAFEGIDAVVHLAASAPVESTWDDVLHNNLIGTYNVFEAARSAGVDRVVFASSNHAVGMFEFEGSPQLFALDDPRRIDHTHPIRPDSLYGVSKAYGEALGRMYHERHGMAVYCLRIGSMLGHDNPYDVDLLASGAGILELTPEQTRQRMRATWLSRADAARLIRQCLVVPDVRWALVYGISDNPRQYWDINHARALLGYDPQDSAPV